MKDPNPLIKALETKLWALDRKHLALEKQELKIRKRLYPLYDLREKYDAKKD